MNKVLLALGAVLVALLAIGSQADAAPTMHNCPQDGKWAISVWTGDETDASEALGTCGNIEVAYALTPTGAWERYIPGAPEVNNMGPLDKYDGVIALGGPAVPVVPAPTNVSIYGTLPDDCSLLTVAERSAGDGDRHARAPTLHDEPPTAVAPADGGLLLTWTYQQMGRIVEFTLLCDDEVLQYVDVPKASGSGHIYTISVLVTGSAYEILPRTHEYMLFDCGMRPDGTIFWCRGYAGEKIPFDPTCPVQWELHGDEGPTCPGYPDAIWGAYRCDNPPSGEQYCNVFD